MNPIDATDAFRLLDACANRAREGVRVVEDFVRFTLDDRHLTCCLKTWRHGLTEALAVIPSQALLAARDTRQDVGTTVHTSREQSRETLADVVRAACKRVEEAVRTLEEAGKLISPDLGERLGQLRYEFYTLEKAILLTQSARGRLEGRVLYILATSELCLCGIEAVILGALAGGVGIVQLREKTLSDRKLAALGRKVREWTAAAGALFIMNDRPDLAVLIGADGVHVGQEELTVRDARRIVGPDRLVGVSTHTLDQARTAVLDGADYIGVGPVFASTTKSSCELAGIEFVRQVAEEITLPAFAIGGISTATIDQVVSAGGRRVAVSAAICGAPDPAETARDLARRIPPD